TQSQNVTYRPPAYALEFDGTDDYCYSEDFEWSLGGPVTVEFWANISSTQANCVFSVGNKENPNRFCLYLPDENGQAAWDYGDTHRIGGRTIVKDFHPYIGRWTHVALVSEGRQGKFTAIYLNGVQKAVETRQSQGPVILLTGLRFGAWFYHNLFFKGRILEFRIWNRVCAQERIGASMYRTMTGNESGLVGYWPMNEGTGLTVSDLCPDVRHAAIFGATWISGIDTDFPQPPEESLRQKISFDKVLKLDGSKSYVEISNNPALDLVDNFTIEAWFNAEQLGGRLLDKAYGGRDEGFTFDTYSNCIRFINKGAYYSISEMLSINKWYHVAVVFSIKADGFGIYLNGQPATLLDSAESHATPTSQGSTTDLPVRLGSQGDSRASLFRGKIAEVRIWQRALLTEEIQANWQYRLSGYEGDLAGYWPLNEGSGEIAYDGSVNSNHGTIHDAAWEVIGTAGHDEEVIKTPVISPDPLALEPDACYSLQLNGTDAYTDFPNLALYGAGPVSVEFWACLNEQTDDQTDVTIFCFQYGTDNYRFNCRLSGEDRRLVWEYYSGNQSDGPISLDFNPFFNQWVHISLISEGQSGHFSAIYIDGGQTRESRDKSYGPGRTFNNFRIGTSWANDAGYLKGRITDFRIWTRARTLEEIQADFRKRL
ncbi:MAG: LamG domain-containing protein, partial [Planctomycetaceae bacterium]|nr:LamG domain-containing protein [Planctomycetaceae bacterium]